MYKRILFFIILLFTYFFAGCFSSAKINITSISGAVINSDFTMIEGAKVVLEKAPDKNDKDGFTIEDETDATGTFVFKDLKPGLYRVTVSKPGYTTQRKIVRLQKDTSKNLTFKLKMTSNAGNTKKPNVNAMSRYNPVRDRIFAAYSADINVTGNSPSSNAPSGVNNLEAIRHGADPLADRGRRRQGVFQDPHLALLDANPNALIIFDAGTNKLKAARPLSKKPVWLLFTRDGRKLYVSDFNNVISAYNPLNNNSYVSSINMGGGIVTDMYVSWDNSRLYITLRSVNPQLVIVDTSTDTPMKVLNLNGMDTPSKSGQPGGVCVSPDNRVIYISYGDAVSGYILAIDAYSYKLLKTVQIQSQPLDIEVTPDGTKLFVCNFNSDTVSVIDTASFKVISTIRVGNKPAKMAIRPDGAYVYVTNKSSNNVSVIDVASNSLIANIPVGQEPIGIAASPDSMRVYVANHKSGNISVIDAQSNALIYTTPPAKYSSPFDVAVRP